MPDSVLKATGIGKRYGRRWVLKDVSLEVFQGEVVTVTGHNGAGKSTLARILAGLLSPSSGEVERPDDLGFMALDMELYPTLSAKEHLEWAADCRECEPRTTELLELFGLADTGTKAIRAFSSGMKARLKLALAIQHRPKLLILDEPTASLDQEGVKVVEKIVNSQTITCLIATNDQTEMAWGHRNINLDAV